MSANSQYIALGRSIRRYVRSYGGIKGIFYSPLLMAAAIISAIDYNNWIYAKWVIQTQEMLPNLLGFSLGTYAILFSLLTTRIKKALGEIKDDKGVSALETVNATFFHFIFIQLLTIVWSFLFNALVNITIDIMLPLVYKYIIVTIYAIGSVIGCFLLNYSLFLVLGSALSIYRLAGITDRGEDAPREIEVKLLETLNRIDRQLHRDN